LSTPNSQGTGSALSSDVQPFMPMRELYTIIEVQ
jgi:hypothetical protein